MGHLNLRIITKLQQKRSKEFPPTNKPDKCMDNKKLHPVLQLNNMLETNMVKNLQSKMKKTTTNKCLKNATKTAKKTTKENVKSKKKKDNSIKTIKENVNSRKKKDNLILKDKQLVYVKMIVNAIAMNIKKKSVSVLKKLNKKNIMLN